MSFQAVLSVSFSFLCVLSGNNPFNFFKGNRPEIIVVYPYIVLVREEHAKPRKVLPSVLLPVHAFPGERPGVDVSEKLPHIPIGPAIGEERVVIEDDALATDADGHLLGDMLETVHETLLHLFHVVVPEDEVNLTIQSTEDVVPFLGAAEREIPKVEDDPVRRDGRVPVLHKGAIHLRDVPEGPGTKPEDILMVEVGVRGEPDPLRLEDPQDVFNWLLVIDATHCCSLSIVPT